MEVGQRERALIGRILALEPGQGVAVGQRIAARLVRKEVLSAHPVRLGQLMIEVGRELILLECRRHDRNDLAALEHLCAVPPAVVPVGAGRNQVGPVGKPRLQQRSRNWVDHAEVDRTVNRIPDGRREVVDACVRAIVGERPRHEHGIARLVHEGGLGLRPLIGPEEERPVPDNRTADGAAPFMPIEDRLVDAGPVEEKVVGHQRVVLVVVVAAAAEAVGAALRDQREVAASVAAGTGVVQARLQLDLLQRFGRGCDVARQRPAAVVDRAARPVDAAVAAQQVGHVDAIEDEAVVGGPGSVHAGRDRSIVVGQQLADVGGDPWLDDQELGEIARGCRQRIELFLIERSLHGHRSRRDHFRACYDLDGLGEAADLERHVDRRHFRGRDREPVAPQLFESAELERDSVRAWCQESNFPVAGRASRDRAHAACFDHGERDRNARNAAPGGVGDPSHQSGVCP